MKSHLADAKTQVAPIEPIDYATLLSRLTEKERGSLERQAAGYESKFGLENADRFRRLVSLLMMLAPSAPKLVGSITMQFFIPDGKYRMQVFALKGLDDGGLMIYAPDVLADAIRIGILAKPKQKEASDVYALPGSADVLTIDALDGKTPNPEVHYKDMTGWNRKAIRITLPAAPSPAQLLAVERLCTLAAGEWKATTTG